MAKKRGRESNVGLVVTLIFFILLSIGLGVATYYGFAQQDKLTKDAAAAAKLQKDAEDERDWNQFQAWTLRADLGQTDGIDDTKLGVLRGQYASKQLGKNAKDREAVEKAITAIESKRYHILAEDPKTKAVAPADVTMAWVTDQKDKEGKALPPRPKYTFDDIYKGLSQLMSAQTEAINAAVAAKDEAEAAKKKADDDKTAAQNTYDAKLKEQNEQNKADLAKRQEEIDTQQKLLDQANKEKNDAIQAGKDQLKVKEKELAGKDQHIKELEDRLASVKDQLDLLAKKQEETPSAGKAIPTDYKIVDMDRSGKQPFVNLGTADAVRPGLTFSIHGRGPDGKPTPASKGTLEVINVINDHLSQAQVVSVKDSLKDPILPGDFLYNPVFKPGGEQHVVIAGRINMHGTPGGNDLDEFERLLQRRNVVVDGYVDPQDGTIKGKLTVGTDYLVLGDMQGAKDTEIASVKALQDQARNNGVQIVKARDFLESMGYKTP